MLKVGLFLKNSSSDCSLLIIIIICFPLIFVDIVLILIRFSLYYLWERFKFIIFLAFLSFKYIQTRVITLPVNISLNDLIKRPFATC